MEISAIKEGEKGEGGPTLNGKCAYKFPYFCGNPFLRSSISRTNLNLCSAISFPESYCVRALSRHIPCAREKTYVLAALESKVSSF